MFKIGHMNSKLDKLLQSLNYQESEICEFQINIKEPYQIGKSLAALSNAAALQAVKQAYLIFGLNKNGQPVGTRFNPSKHYKGDKLMTWLTRYLFPELYVTADSFKLDSKKVVVLTIEATSYAPATFKFRNYIRAGCQNKLLRPKSPAKADLEALLARQSDLAQKVLDDLGGRKFIEKLDWSFKPRILTPSLSAQVIEDVDRLLDSKIVRRYGRQYGFTPLGKVLLHRYVLQGMLEELE